MKKIIKADPDLVSRVVPHLSLEGLRLMRSIVEVMDPIDEDLPDNAIFFQFTEKTGCVRIGDRLHVQVQCTALVCSHPAGLQGAPPRPVLPGDAARHGFVDATYALEYSIKPGVQLSDEDLKRFSHVTGLYNAWPFWRECLTSSLARVELPGFVLPLMRVVTEKRKAADQSSPPTKNEPASAPPSSPVPAT